MISVIIPTWNEAPTIRNLLGSLRQGDDPLEMIVVDGGSSDETRREATSVSGVRWIQSKRGRGVQMNAGAKEATGRILLFLHADTKLPADWSRIVREAAQRKGFSLGAFRFALDRKGWRYRLIELGVLWRCRLFQLPYGDQALFVKTELLKSSGGFPEVPIMEDVAFVRLLRKQGRIITTRQRAVTSARRWDRYGVLRQSFMNLSTYALYRFGASLDYLARRYRKSSRAIVVLCKYPTPGKVKTRLAATVGEKEAARVYDHLVHHTLRCIRKSHCGARIYVFFTPRQAENKVRRWLGKQHVLIPQCEGDLGDRMIEAFRHTFRSRYRETVVIGTDCPQLMSSHLNEAFRQLATNELILGPTEDGGYYLIGARQPYPELFNGINWSTDSVLEETLTAARNAKISYWLMPQLRDVDTEEDLQAMPTGYRLCR